MAWAIDEPPATLGKVLSSQAFSAATSGLAFSCRTTRRSTSIRLADELEMVEDDAYASALPGKSFDFVHARFCWLR